MKNISFKKAIREAMIEEMKKNKNIFLVGEEVGSYGGAFKISQNMLKEFGNKRIIDTPISELGFSGLGIGAAMNGLKPIIEFMTFNFSLVAIDQIINSGSKINLMSGGQFSIPIVFRGPTGSAGMLGSQHSQNFENWYSNCPGLKVVVPSCPYDAKGLLKSSIRDNNPVIFMESELMYNDKEKIPNKEYLVPLGKAIIKKKGNDVTIVSFGKMIKVAIKVAEKMKKEKINIEVIDLRTIKPIDIKCIISSVKKTNRLIIIEESWPFGSISSEISYQIQKKLFSYLKKPIYKINNLEIPFPYSSKLSKNTLPVSKKIVSVIKNIL